mgnify:CR=1 FL=1
MRLPWNVTTRPWRIVDSGEMRAKEKLVNLVGGTRGQFVVAERLREADAEAIIKALEQLESGARGL